MSRIIYTGADNITEYLKLEPGDRFHVCLRWGPEGNGQPGIENPTPNTVERMLAYNGQWLTVSDVYDYRDSYYTPQGDAYMGHAHISKTCPRWEWYWYHMDAVERKSDKQNTCLYPSLPEI